MDGEHSPALNYNFYDRPDTEDYNKYMQNMSKPIEALILKLRGLEIVFDEKTNKWTPHKTADALMNEKGINYFSGMLESYLTPNLYMAQLDEGQANRYIKGTKKQIGKIINANRIEWDIVIQNIRPLISLICSIVAFGITKSRSDKQFLTDTTQAKYQNVSRDGLPRMPGNNFGF